MLLRNFDSIVSAEDCRSSFRIEIDGSAKLPADVLASCCRTKICLQNLASCRGLQARANDGAVFAPPPELRAFVRKAYYIAPKRYSAEIDVRLPDIGKPLLLA